MGGGKALALLLALSAALAVPASSTAAGKAATVVLRGPQAPPPQAPPTPEPPAPPARSSAALSFSPLPDSAPRFSLDAAPRLGGMSDGLAGQCRRSCSRDYYLCDSTDDPADCSRTWSQCLAACGAGGP